MLSSASTVNAKPALPPTSTAPSPQPASAGGVSFADYLSQQPALPPATAAPAPKEPAAKTPDSDAKAPEPAAAAKASAAPAPAAQRRKDTAKTPDKAADGQARPADVDAKAAQTRNTEAAATTTDEDTSTDGDAMPDPLAELTQLIGLATPNAPTPAATAEAASSEGPARGNARAREARVTGSTPGQDDAAGANPAGVAATDSRPAPGTERRTAEGAARAADATRAKAADVASDKAAASARTQGTDALQTSTARSDSNAPRPAALEGATPAFAAVLAQALPQGPAAAESAKPPATGRVEAALQSNHFGPELAASVSLLAVDGVQQAELQLNPAEMGPVAVQIVVDGAQAQVSFHAVQAETRQALEQSLPDLAAALQGQGLTLAGGGVFQQAPRDTQGGNDRGGNRDSGSRVAGVSGGRDSGAAAAPVTVTRRANGLLDTFA